jgi:ammonia channel protein AmtB
LVIVLLLCFSIAPIPPSILMTFLIGAILLIIGMLLFNVSVDLASQKRT